MGEKGEGSGGEGGGKWEERGRELGMGYPLSTPSVRNGTVNTLFPLLFFESCASSVPTDSPLPLPEANSGATELPLPPVR